MTIAASLDAAIAAAIPRAAFSGVSIARVYKGETVRPDINDKTRWVVNFTDQATDAHKLTAASVVAAFDPATVHVPRRVDFETAMERLTDAEDAALDAACASNQRLKRWYRRARTRGSIDLNDDEVKTALAAVVQSGLFTKARLAELFAD